jgi:hypothetical protein
MAHQQFEDRCVAPLSPRSSNRPDSVLDAAPLRGQKRPARVRVSALGETVDRPPAAAYDAAALSGLGLQHEEVR